MKQAGQQSNVLNIDPRAPESNEYIKISSALSLAREIVRHVWNDWVLHVHTNGHNAKSWIIALGCGLAAQFGSGATLTLHSGMVPSYIGSARPWMRRFVSFTCVLYRQVVCVSDDIASTVAGLGVAKEMIQITPAYLPIGKPDAVVPAEIEDWIQRHSPVVSSAMFFRPEYGFESLVEAIARLRRRYPRIGCVVMGCQDHGEAAALIASQELEDGMLLAGDLDHDLCLAVMARSAVFVRPTFRDGDSISVREAVTLGVPVVASNVGTRPEGVFLFEAGDVSGLVAEIQRALTESDCS